MGYTVSSRARSYVQPKSGFIPPVLFVSKKYNDGKRLNYKENIEARYLGEAVDYLTRYRITGDAEEAFDISIRGVNIMYQETGNKTLRDYARDCFSRIKKDDVAAAIQLSAFDDAYRAGKFDIPQLEPDKDTVENVDIMTNRGVEFLQNSSNQIYPGLDFRGAYTDIIVNGDCDYVTDNSIIDFKVIRGEISEKYTLQILMYYLMGLHSKHKEIFEKLEWLAFFNPRKNLVYYHRISNIPESVLDEVARKVIGYK